MAQAKHATPPDPAPVVINYTNYRGETGDRRIRPIRIWFGEVAWHPGRQWLMDAIDLDRNVERTFALNDIHSWQQIDILTD